MNRIQRANRQKKSALIYGPALIHGAAVPGRRVRGKFFGTFGATVPAEGKHIAFQRGGWVRNNSAQTTLALGFENLPAATTTLSGAVVRGATSLPIVAASIAPGFYWLGTRTIVDGGVGSRQAGGELVQVTASSANTATLSRPLIRGHASGAGLSLVPVSRNVRISGMRAFGVRDVTENHIYVGTALGLTVENCQLSGSQIQSVYCIRSSDVLIRNIQIQDTPPQSTGTGIGYAVGPAQSVRMTIQNVHASNSRHCVSITGSCAEVTVTAISSAANGFCVFDDHDGSEFVTVRGAFAPPLATSSTASGVGIQLGNSAWTWEGADYTLEDCTSDWIELRHRRLRHTFNRCTARFFVAATGSNTSNGFAQRFQQITFQNGALLGRQPDTTVQLGPSGGATPVEIDRLLFVGNSLAVGAPERHLVTVGPTQGTWTNYGLRIEGGTITAMRPNSTGARVILQAGSGTSTSEFRAEVTGTTITPDEAQGGTTTPLFGRISAVAGSNMTAALATSATFRGAALAAGNVGGTGVTHSSVVTV